MAGKKKVELKWVAGICYAHLTDDHQIMGSGKSPAAAVGDMVIKHGPVLDMAVESTDSIAFEEAA